MPLLSHSERAESLLGSCGVTAGVTDAVRMADSCGPVPVIAVRTATKSRGNRPPSDLFRQIAERLRAKCVAVLTPASFSSAIDSLVDDGRRGAAVERRCEQPLRPGGQGEMKSPDEWIAA